ncbi:MAG TPA: hypothetical protein VKE40_00245 [Gemmataceae bacterium]|nr:hypothetical protein [Gemmataceae bacterium]
MGFLVAILSVLPSGDPAPRSKPGDVVRPPEVSAVIAAPVRFPDQARERVAEAGLALLASCHYAHVPNEGAMPEWDDTLLNTRNKSAYLHIRLAAARAVETAGGATVEVSEMIVVFPLNNGSIRVRNGDRAKRFGKNTQAAGGRLQGLLKEAEPVK